MVRGATRGHQIGWSKRLTLRGQHDTDGAPTWPRLLGPLERENATVESTHRHQAFRHRKRLVADQGLARRCETRSEWLHSSCSFTQCGIGRLDGFVDVIAAVRQ